MIISWRPAWVASSAPSAPWSSVSWPSVPAAANASTSSRLLVSGSTSRSQECPQGSAARQFWSCSLYQYGCLINCGSSLLPSLSCSANLQTATDWPSFLPSSAQAPPASSMLYLSKLGPIKSYCEGPPPQNCLFSSNHFSNFQAFPASSSSLRSLSLQVANCRFFV